MSIEQAQQLKEAYFNGMLRVMIDDYLKEQADEPAIEFSTSSNNFPSLANAPAFKPASNKAKPREGFKTIPACQVTLSEHVIKSEEEFPSLSASSPAAHKNKSKNAGKSKVATTPAQSNDVQDTVASLDLASQLKLKHLQESFANVPVGELLPIFLRNNKNLQAAIADVKASIPTAIFTFAFSCLTQLASHMAMHACLLIHFFPGLSQRKSAHPQTASSQCPGKHSPFSPRVKRRCCGLKQASRWARRSFADRINVKWKYLQLKQQYLNTRQEAIDHAVQRNRLFQQATHVGF